MLRGTEEQEIELTFAKPAEPKGSGADADLKRAIDPNALFGARFQIGLPATIEITAVPGRVFKGHVKSVASVAAASGLDVARR